MNTTQSYGNLGIGRRIWRLIYPVLTYIGFCYIVQLFYALTIGMSIMKTMDLTSTTMMNDFAKQMVSALLEKGNLLQGIGALLALPVLLRYRRDDQKRFEALGIRKYYEKAPLYLFAFAAVLGIVTCLLGNNLILVSIREIISESFDEVAEEIYQGNILVELLSLGIIVPIAEEVIFRGLIYPRLRERYSVVVSALLMAFGFAVFHGNLLQGIYAFFMSLLLIYVYERYHSLLAPIIFHIAANLISVIGTETGCLDFMYKDKAIFWAVTVFIAVVLIFCVVGIEYTVYVKEVVPAEPEAAMEDSSSEEEESN